MRYAQRDLRFFEEDDRDTREDNNNANPAYAQLIVNTRQTGFVRVVKLKRLVMKRSEKA